MPDTAPTTDIFKAIKTCRAIRRFKPDPIPDEVLGRILDAAVHAPSGGNAQPWVFLVLRDSAVKRKLGDLYNSALESRYAGAAGGGNPPSHWRDVPVLVMVCRRELDPPVATSTASLYASMYPAVQNILLAARALGVGSCLTTVHKLRDAEVNELLGIPAGVETVACIPLGYPRGGFGPVVRKPWQEVTYYDRWGTRADREAQVESQR
jgi:nitroreductase